MGVLLKYLFLLIGSRGFTVKARYGLVLLVVASMDFNEAIAVTKSNRANPNWTNSSHWTGSAPNYDMTQSATLAHDSNITSPILVNDGYTLIINEGVTLTTNRVITIKEGGTLIINGAIKGTSSSKEFKIEKGTLIVGPTGSFNWDGFWTSDDDPSDITVDGVVNLGGDMSNKVDIDGEGSFQIEGELENDGGKIFDCDKSGSRCCNGSPCAIPEPALPVELLNFQATYRDNAVHLTWSTATELDNDYFSIERSHKNGDWHTIASIPGAGDSRTKISYEYTDHIPPRGLLFYRLKQTDYDGAFEFKEVSNVYSSSEDDLIVYPNPCGSSFKLNLVEGEKAQFTVRNNMGQRFVLPYVVTLHDVMFDTSGLGHGVYFIATRLGTEVFTTSFVVQ